MERPPLAYFCHMCRRTAPQPADGETRCSLCGGDFVEEVQSTTMPPPQHVAGFPDFFNLAGYPSSSSATPPNPGGPANPGSRPQQQQPNASQGFGNLFGSLFNLFEGNFLQPQPNPAQAGGGLPQQQQQQGQQGQRQHIHLEVQPDGRIQMVFGGGGAQEGQAQPNQQQQQQQQFMPPGMNQFVTQVLTGLLGGGDGRQGFTFNLTGGGPMRGDGQAAAGGVLGDYVFTQGGLDAVITALLNQTEGIGGARPQMTQEQLARLPMVDVVQKQVDDAAQCATCMENLVLGESVARLTCSHCFHRDCIVPWIERRYSCPVCRANVEPNEWPPAAATATSDTQPPQQQPPPPAEFQDDLEQLD